MLKIKESIRNRGLTIADVAAKIGITQPSLSSIINGNPTFENLTKIADALNVHITELFDKPQQTHNAITCPKCGAKLKITEE